MRSNGLIVFLGVLAGLFLLRLPLAYMAAPASLALPLSIVVTLLFVAAPILALFAAASHPWSTRLALGFIAVGVAFHALGFVLAERALGGRGMAAVLLSSLAQTGLILWTVGLGALLGGFLKDKNLLLPVSAFLAGFDMFLVFAPIGPTRRIVESNPAVFKSVAYQAPRVASGEVKGFVEALAYVGPADFFFLAMFFVALYRFDMRARQTLAWIVPVLLIYLLTVIFFGGVTLGPIRLGTLPALLPIGLTVLLVNRNEFRLTGEEKALTWIVALIAVGLAAYGVALSKRASVESGPTLPPAPSTPVDGQEAPAPEGSR